ncbi:hypothetical protein Q3G72_001436 [Acer saccharum]|nr:hypothetical protein Q3G72_001436 [Acer saccharum]
MINGMHVYGWLIQAKVASVGWNNRRQQELRRRQHREQEREFKEKFIREEVQLEQSNRDRSFKEALVGNRGDHGEQKASTNVKDMTMTWSPKKGDSEWLDRCAVGKERMIPISKPRPKPAANGKLVLEKGLSHRKVFSDSGAASSSSTEDVDDFNVLGGKCSNKKGNKVKWAMEKRASKKRASGGEPDGEREGF